MGQQEQKSSGDAGEASGEDTNKTTSDVEHNNDGGKSGGALKGSDIQKHAGAQEQQKDSDGTGKKEQMESSRDCRRHGRVTQRGIYFSGSDDCVTAALRGIQRIQEAQKR